MNVHYTVFINIDVKPLNVLTKGTNTFSSLKWSVLWKVISKLFWGITCSNALIDYIILDKIILGEGLGWLNA